MAAEGEVIVIHSIEEWDGHFAAATESGKLIVIDFTASWCAPCRSIAPFFAEMAKKFTDVAFFKVDVDELKILAEQYNVQAMPTFVFIKNREIIDTVIGGRKDQIQQKLEMLTAVAAA